MLHEKLSRLGARAALIGAVIVGVAVPLTPHGYDNPLRPVTALAALIGGILIVLGAPALFERIWDRSFALGMVSYVALMVAILVFQVALGAIEGILLPYLASHGGVPLKPPTAMSVLGLVGLAAQMIGTLGLVAVVFRSRSYPRWLAGLLLAALVTAVLPIPIQLDAAFIGASFVVMAAYTLGWRSDNRQPASDSRPPQTARV